MYYFLTLIGIIFIVLGINVDESVSPPDSITHPDEFEDLLKRIEGLESTLYDVDLDFEDEEEEVELIENNFTSLGSTIDMTDAPLTIFDRLKQCEEEGYSLEKTCLILNMNKGEVLLLKNLYKNYQV